MRLSNMGQFHGQIVLPGSCGTMGKATENDSSTCEQQTSEDFTSLANSVNSPRRIDPLLKATATVLAMRGVECGGIPTRW
jgi:hypothetical protein